MSKKTKINSDIRYEVITQEDPETGDLILPIPPEVLKNLSWKEGDNLNFDIGKDGTIYIKKV